MALTRTAANVSPLPGAQCRKYDAGGALTLGDPFYIASDGDVEEAQANLAATSKAEGVIVSVNDSAGGTTAEAGDVVTVCHFGPVAGWTGMTPGGTVWLDDSTAGTLTQTQPSGAATWSRVIGFAEAADVLFIQPGTTEPSSNS